MNITDAWGNSGTRPLFVCDFSPPRSADPVVLEQARALDADFISVAYSPGRAVRADSAMLAAAIRNNLQKEVMFTIATRDMNKLALHSHLLGARLLGLENVVVVGGDPLSARDLQRTQAVNDVSPSEFIGSIREMNQGTDFRGSKLQENIDLCVGGSIDIGRGTNREASLTYRKVQAGVQFFLAQPVWSAEGVREFLATYRQIAGEDLRQPVFWGVHILEQESVAFGSVPAWVREKLDEGRPGTEIALDLVNELFQGGIRSIYLVPPVLRGGARSYEAGQEVLAAARGL
ncbi:MAG: methylenetetrahydrofolate reductase [Dehalococcoidia bacterium]|nr:methylenetetrahydrofolate reductase [Dehalococcoidia bacterium]